MTKNSITLFALALAIAALGNIDIAADDSAKKPGSSDSSTNTHEQAIRNSARMFTDAFNKRDAEAIAGQFIEEAEYVGEDGEVIAGRADIAAEFVAVFENSPELTIETVIESIRFYGKVVAVEKGTTRVTRAKGEQPAEGGYTVVHVNTDKGWKIARVREVKRAPQTNYHRLKELEWMVGDWIDEGEDSVIVTSCNWSKNKNYLLRTFKVRTSGEDTIEGTTRIGWDPLTNKIKSWTFDTEGGYAEGLWTNDGDRWIVKTTGVLRDGQTASATNVFTYIDSSTCTWQSVDRTVGGELMPNIEELTIVRRPPKAQ